MAGLTIQFDDSLVDQLRQLASQNGHTVEEEAKEVVTRALIYQRYSDRGLTVHLDESFLAPLVSLASHQGCSVTEVVQSIVLRALDARASTPEYGLGSKINAKFALLGGLEVPPRNGDFPREFEFDS